MSGAADFQSWVRKQGTPVNLAIIGSMVLAALVFWFTQGKSMEQLMIAGNSHERPWSFLTYAWTAMPFSSPFTIVCFAFLMIWLFMAGGFVEREMGSSRYAVLWLVVILLIGFTVWAGIHVANAGGYAMGGVWLPVSAITMIWCARNLTSVIMLYGIIPLSGKWLAVVDVIIVILVYGSSNPLMGVFAALPLVGLFFYGAERLPMLRYRAAPREVHATRAQARYDDKYYEDVRAREQEREERERLRKLFEGSLKDDDK